MAKYYVGHKGGKMNEIFRSDTKPTSETHGHLYFAATGPCRTKRGAEILRDNPLCITVSEAERKARRERHG